MSKGEDGGIDEVKDVDSQKAVMDNICNIAFWIESNKFKVKAKVCY